MIGNSPAIALSRKYFYVAILNTQVYRPQIVSSLGLDGFYSMFKTRRRDVEDGKVQTNPISKLCSFVNGITLHTL